MQLHLQAVLKCSQPSPIMPLHHICKAVPFLSPILLYHPYITHFLIQRTFICLLYIYTVYILSGYLNSCLVTDKDDRQQRVADQFRLYGKRVFCGQLIWCVRVFFILYSRITFVNFSPCFKRLTSDSDNREVVVLIICRHLSCHKLIPQCWWRGETFQF